MLTNQWTTVIIFVLVIGALLPQPSSIHIIHGYLKQSFSKIGILHTIVHVTYMYVPCQTSTGENEYQVYFMLDCISPKDIAW